MFPYSKSEDEHKKGERKFSRGDRPSCGRERSRRRGKKQETDRWTTNGEAEGARTYARPPPAGIREGARTILTSSQRNLAFQRPPSRRRKRKEARTAGKFHIHVSFR